MSPVVPDESYLTVAEADAAAARMFGLDHWPAADAVDKGRALAEATLRVDARRYQGRRAAEGQARQFPRTGASSVPAAVLSAVVAEADAILGGVLARRQQAADGRVVAGESVGPVSVSYAAKPAGSAAAADDLCERADVLLRPYRLRTGRLV